MTGTEEQPPVRVVIYLREPADAPGAVATAYQEIDWVNDPAKGLRYSELLRDAEDQHDFVLHSEWDHLDAFRAWQNGPQHQSRPSALRPFQDRSRGRHYVVYQVAERDAAGSRQLMTRDRPGGDTT